MAIPSLFPLFLKGSVGVVGIIYGSSITTEVQSQVSVAIEGEISTDKLGAPLVVESELSVALEAEINVELEDC